MTSQTIGFIGLGKMGGAMALNLLNAAPGLIVADVMSDPVKRLTDAGAASAPHPRAIAEQCDMVLLCLPSAKEVRCVFDGEDGLLAGARDGLTVVDTTTLDRSEALAFADELAERGVAYADCPVSGAPFRAEAGTLTVMFGGTAEAFAKARPLLDTFGQDVVHAGPIGAGQAMKAINNIVYNVNIAAISEALPLAMAVGLDPDVVAKVLTTASGRSFASEYFIPRMIERRFDFDFTLNGAYKDVLNVQQMAVETRASTPVINAMISSYQAAIAQGYGDQPKSAMLKVYEKALGVEFKAHETSEVESGGNSGSAA